MNNFKVICIDSNEFKIDDLIFKKNPNFSKKDNKTILELKTNYLNIKESINVISKFCKIEDTNNDKLIELAYDYIDLKDNYGDTKDCYEGSNYIIQIMYKMPNNNDNLNKLNYNLLASSITLDKELIYEKVIIFKTKIDLNGDKDEIVDISLDEVLQLFMCNYYHSGVKIDRFNNISQIYFNNDFKIIEPFNNWNIDENENQILTDKNYGTNEKNYFGFKLLIYFNPKCTDEELNDGLSRLLKATLRGDCVIISPNNLNSFYELQKNDIIEMLKLWNKLEEISIIDTNITYKYKILNNKINLENN